MAAESRTGFMTNEGRRAKAKSPGSLAPQTRNRRRTTTPSAAFFGHLRFHGQ
jgi:hypothetical protein